MFWKGKKKGKTGGAGGPKRGTAHFRSFVATEKFYRDRVSLTLGRDRVFNVATRCGQAGRPCVATPQLCHYKVAQRTLISTCGNKCDKRVVRAAASTNWAPTHERN